MKRYITLFLIALTALMAGCKKEDQTNFPKLKSVTHTPSSGDIFKTEFDYNSEQQLLQTRTYVNNVLQTYVNYTFIDGKPTNAKAFAKSNVGDDELANITFEYTGDQLRALRVRTTNTPPGSTLATDYAFDYSKGNIPTLTISYTNNDQAIPNTGSIIIRPIDPTTGQESNESDQLIDLTKGKVFDNKRNPFYGLPLITYLPIQLPHIPYPHSFYGFSFDATLFFHNNNVTHEVVSTTYVYNKQGMPIKSSRAFGIGNSKLETTFEYWQ